jgi:NAD(P)H dehydrogenase (quinone)
MEQINVVIAFYSRYCRAESLALNVGLGVLEARATPRFRRLADLAPESAIESDPEWKSNLRRMKIEYVAPRPGDPKLADVLVLVTPGDETNEVLRYAESLATDGSMAGKIAAPVAARNQEEALVPIYAAVARTGMIIVPPLTSDDPADAARRHGAALVKIARVLKAARSST